MKYLIMLNNNYEKTAYGWPLGVVDSISEWVEFQNICIFEINPDGTIGRVVKHCCEGTLSTDGYSVYKDCGDNWENIGALSEYLQRYFD